MFHWVARAVKLSKLQKNGALNEALIVKPEVFRLCLLCVVVD